MNMWEFLFKLSILGLIFLQSYKNWENRRRIDELSDHMSALIRKLTGGPNAS